MRLSLDFDSGQTNRTVYLDYASVTGTGIELPQEPEVLWGPQATATFDALPPITKASDVNLATDFGNPGGSLRSDGNGSWWLFNTNSYGYANGDFDVSYDVYYPASSSRDIIDIGFWTTGSGTAATGYMIHHESSGSSGGIYSVSNGKFSRVPGDTTIPTLAREKWHRVTLTTVGSNLTATVTRLDTGAVIHTKTLDLPPGNRAGVFGQLKSGTGASVGHRVDNFAVRKGSGAGVTPVVRSDATKARSGSGYLELTTPAGVSASMVRSVTATPILGNTYTARAWVKAPSGNVTGKLTFSSGPESISTNFTADATWREVLVSLPITKTGSTGFTLTVDHFTAGKTLHLDDAGVQLVGLTQPETWVASPGSGGTMPTAVWSDSTAAHAGVGYLQTQANSAAGSVFKDSVVSVQAGSQYTAAVWVRSPRGTPVNGQLKLTKQGGPEPARSVGFTADGSWQQVYVTLPISAAGTDATLRTEVRLTTLGVPLDIDDGELRPIADWAPTAPTGVSANALVVVDPGQAASGPGYLRVNSTGPDGGVAAATTTTIRAGATYTMEAYVRSGTGASLPGQLRLTADGTSGESTSLPFTATADWQWVQLEFSATRSNTTLRPTVLASAAGVLEVDGIRITPDVVVQEDPWVTQVAPGGSVSATIYDDPERAQDSNGVMVLSASGAGENGIYHDIGEAPKPGTSYAGSAWVRSTNGTPVNGRFVLETRGGSGPVQASAPFVAGAEWSLVNLRMTPSGSGYNGLRATVLVSTPGVELDIDNVKVQEEVWSSFTAPGGTVTHTQINDGEQAESGSGYLQVSKSTGSEGGVELVTPGNVAAGSQQTASAYVRSPSGGEVPGRLRLTAEGGNATDTREVRFTADEQWRKVSVTLPVGGDGQSALRTAVLVDSVGSTLDLDSVTIGQEPLGKPDGVTAPLPHPESGYAYLWDDAFGIPGAHLWALTAQIQYINGAPGLGVGATMYFDPTKAPGIMTGTEWLKGDMALNASRVDPCFSFGFDGSGTDTRVEIDGGVFSTEKFAISFAPRGCEVGDYVVPAGASLGIDTELGDSPIHLDMAITRDEGNGPRFTTELAVYDLKLAGTTYNTMELSIDASAAESTTRFVGDFTLPMGKFYGDFELDRNSDKLRMAGDVRVSDWQLVGGSFDVTVFAYRQEMEIPFGAGECADFSAATNGDMSMGGKQYLFVGELALDCGRLERLRFGFDYMKSGVAYAFLIDYDSRSRMLAGGIDFKFERKTSWRFVFKRYKRHPKFEIGLDFAMNVDKPSSAALTLDGKISVSGGSGSLMCSINTGKDDGCDLEVKIRVFGGHTYRSKW
jgi:hypothetical protein